MLLAVWGLGSMLGGFAAARAGAPADAARWLALLLAALGLGDLALVPIASPAALAPILLVAGAAVRRCSERPTRSWTGSPPRSGQTEAFAWLTTAIGIGLAGGSALAGVAHRGRGSGRRLRHGGRPRPRRVRDHQGPPRVTANAGQTPHVSSSELPVIARRLIDAEELEDRRGDVRQDAAVAQRGLVGDDQRDRVERVAVSGEPSGSSISSALP